MTDSTYEALIAEAVGQPMEGWDFRWLRDRAPTTQKLPWNYEALAAEAVARARRMLDMGTGGGEALSRLARRAEFTVANEAWLPNVPVAASNLRSHGIPVVQDEGAPDNMDQAGDPVRGRLPYRAEAFDLVLNRHESFASPEVHRVLRTGGMFITQQVDFRTYDDLYEALELDPPAEEDSWLPLAVSQLEEAGFDVQDARQGEEIQSFRDVGAFVWYLLAVSWPVPEFDLERCDAALRRLHERMRDAPLPVRQRRLLVVAQR